MNQFRKPVTMAVCLATLDTDPDKLPSIGKNDHRERVHLSSGEKLSYVGSLGIAREYRYFNINIHTWEKPDERLLADAQIISMKIPAENLFPKLPHGDYHFTVEDRTVAVCSHIQHSCVYVTVQKYDDLYGFFDRLNSGHLVRDPKSHGEFDQLLLSYKTAHYEMRQFAGDLRKIGEMLYPLASRKNIIAKLTCYLLAKFFQIEISVDQKHTGSALIRQET